MEKKNQHEKAKQVNGAAFAAGAGAKLGIKAPPYSVSSNSISKSKPEQKLDINLEEKAPFPKPPMYTPPATPDANAKSQKPKNLLPPFNPAIFGDIKPAAKKKPVMLSKELQEGIETQKKLGLYVPPPENIPEQQTISEYGPDKIQRHLSILNELEAEIKDFAVNEIGTKMPVGGQAGSIVKGLFHIKKLINGTDVLSKGAINLKSHFNNGMSHGDKMELLRYIHESRAAHNAMLNN